MGYTPPWLAVKKVASNVNDLSISGSMPYLEFTDSNNIQLFANTAKGLSFYDITGADYLLINWVTPDCQLSTYTNYNLALLPQGTGKVKFGTFTGSGDVAVNGSIAILDSAGNARKLATVA